jgi:hypothetical protein
VSDENENYWSGLTGLRISGPTRSADTRDLITVPCFTPSPFTAEFWDDFSRASDKVRRGILDQWLKNRETAPDGSEAARVFNEQITQLMTALTTGCPPASPLHDREQTFPFPDNSRQSQRTEANSPRNIAVPTIAAIQEALRRGLRREAVQLRNELDSCPVKTLWSEAFSSRRCKPKTMQTAFNRWQASRKDAPSWADGLMRARLLK